MNFKKTIQMAFLSSCALALPFSSCNSDDPEPPNSDNPTDFSSDLLGGTMIFCVDYADMAELRCPVNASEPVSFEVLNDAPFSLESEEIDGVSYMVPISHSAIMDPVNVVVARATGTETGDKRTFVLIVRNTTETAAEAARRTADRNSSPSKRLLEVYGEFLGKGTLCFNQIGNTTRSILMYNTLPLDDENLLMAQGLDRVDMYEVEGETFKSTMESWSFDVGLSMGGIGKVGLGNKWSLSGSFNFGMEGSLATSDDYEYYMNLLKVERAEMKLNMTSFESMTKANAKKASQFLGYVAPQFIEDIFASTDSINTQTFFNQWGTDMIYQGLVGGYNVYLYGREENTYDHTLGVDVGVKLKGSKTSDPTGRTWYDIYKSKNSPYIGGEFNFGYSSEEYFKASKAQSLMRTVGGNPVSDNNAAKWIEGFEDVDENMKWQLISYRRHSDEAAVQKDDVWLLYPTESMAMNVVISLETILKDVELSDADRAILANAKANVHRLADNKGAYIQRYLTQPKPKTRLVLCDIMMKNNNNRRKSGDPKPFVAPDPRNPTKYRTYYPMMANKYFDSGRSSAKQRGRAIDTNDDCFLASGHGSSHYWYYCLAHEDDCDGIVDIQFYSDSHDYYVPRGSKASDHSGLCNYPRRVCVRYFDAGAGHKPEMKITAFGIWDEYDKHIIATTGGSELRMSATESEFNIWKNFWTDYKKNSVRFYEGGGVNPHFIYPCYSTKNLPIEKVSASTVSHPGTW